MTVIHFSHVDGRLAVFTTDTGRTFRKPQAAIDEACSRIDPTVFPNHVDEYVKATIELRKASSSARAKRPKISPIMGATLP